MYIYSLKEKNVASFCFLEFGADTWGLLAPEEGLYHWEALVKPCLDTPEIHCYADLCLSLSLPAHFPWSALPTSTHGSNLQFPEEGDEGTWRAPPNPVIPRECSARREH